MLVDPNPVQRNRVYLIKTQCHFQITDHTAFAFKRIVPNLTGGGCKIYRLRNSESTHGVFEVYYIFRQKAFSGITIHSTCHVICT